MDVGRVNPVNCPCPVGDARDKQAQKLNILVVDDEPGLLEVLREILGFFGHTVVTANDGKKGLEEFLKRDFDLVFTDQRMPNMTGSELAKRIKELKPTVPVIAFSATPNEVETVNEAGEKMVDFVLGKPATMNDITKAIDLVIGS